LFFKSIRFTLTFWYSVTLGIILILFCTGSYLVIRQQIYREVDGELLAIAEALASPTLTPFRETAPSVFDQVLEDFIGPKSSGKFVQIIDGAGAIKARSGNLAEFTLPYSRADLRKAGRGMATFATRTIIPSTTLRTICFPILEDGKLTHAVLVGASLREEQASLNRIFLVFLVSTPLSLFLVGYGGWFLAGQALKPVEKITASARKITAENLGLRLKIDNPRDEIGQLAATFNETLARLEDSFTRTRRFNIDVSHELRTPLTILRGDTEVGLKWAKVPEEFRALLQSNLDEIGRISDIIEHLLELSRAAEGKLSLVTEEVDLEELLRALLKDSAPLAEESSIMLSFSGGNGLSVQGDRKKLRAVFATLLENAVRYTGAGGEVRVTLERVAGQAQVAVRDTGIGIAPEHLPYIFDQFYRIDSARNRAHGGIGLGLSLAKSFVVAHGGDIHVESRAGQGSVFTVILPLAPADPEEVAEG